MRARHEEADKRPEVKKRRKDARNDPEVKKRLKESCKEAWKRPEVRARHKEARKDPEYNERHKEACKDAWKDPEVKKRCYEKKWIAKDREMIQRLREWKEKHGHVRVPAREPGLGRWLIGKRENMREGRWMHPETENALRELGVQSTL